MPEELSIRKLTRENLGDFISFFDNRAFCDNPDWAPCYCCFYYFPDDDAWEARTAEQNRSCAGDYISEGKMNGFLAYRGNAVVGWCNADKKENFPRIMEEPEIGDDEGRSAVVVCFVTDPDHRRQGIAGKLLAAACSDFRKAGFDYIEAYPRKVQQGDANNYHGPAEMYKVQGFNLYREAEEFLIMRKSLK